MNYEEIENKILDLPTQRYGTQYGWYVYINRCKTDFGGIHITLEESRNYAIQFINELNEYLQHIQIAGSPLEPSLPPTFGNICGELG
jgi:molybdate-binding protein